MPSAREKLVGAAKVCLSAITVANGYHTDVGQKVTSEPGQVDKDAAGVIAVVIGRQRRASDQALRRTHRLTDLDIYAKVPASMSDAQGRLDLLIDDIERAMAGQQRQFAVGITFPQYEEMVPIPAEPGMNWIGAIVRFTTHIPIH